MLDFDILLQKKNIDPNFHRRSAKFSAHLFNPAKKKKRMTSFCGDETFKDWKEKSHLTATVLVTSQVQLVLKKLTNLLKICINDKASCPPKAPTALNKSQ